MKFKVEGVKVYDPRKKEYVVSDNPALIMGHMLSTGMVLSKFESTLSDLNHPDWEKIAKLADFCDEEVEDGN